MCEETSESLTSDRDEPRDLANIRFVGPRVSLAIPSMVIPAETWAKIVQSLQPGIGALSQASFGLAESFRPTLEVIANQFGQRIAALARDLSGLEGGWARSLPENWRDTGSASAVLQIVDMMKATSWCLVWCPRREVLDRLLGTSVHLDRVRILLESKDLILHDLRESLGCVAEESLGEYCAAALKAVAAFKDGHVEAAQALAASCLSGVIGSVYELKFNNAREEFRSDPREATLTEFRASCVDMLLFESLQPFQAWNGDPVPGTFSRHASAHGVSTVQFSEVNSLASLLLLNGFLRETQLRAVEQKEDLA